MIRLPSTTIVLGPSDIRDFHERRRLRKAMEAEQSMNQQLARFALHSHDGPCFEGYEQYRGGLHEMATHPMEARAIEEDNFRCLTLQASLSMESVQRAFSGQEDSSQSVVNDGYLTFTNLPEEGYVTIGFAVFPENTTSQTQQSGSPSKDEFHYGGFMERPIDRNVDGSSPFAPDDVSTPPHLQVPEARRHGNRVLPRSPLFISQNASSSPERHPTGLTPRVESRVATHNTLGIIFSQPPRRPRRSPRAFRHQTNSFSFDSSERSSATYQQDRASSTSTNDSTPRPSDELSLHEESRGSSLQSSRAVSAMSASFPVSMLSSESMLNLQNGTDEATAAATAARDSLFSSSELPPPFSAVSRSVSTLDSLPLMAGEYSSVSSNPQTSPLERRWSSPMRTGVEGRRPTPAAKYTIEMASSPPSRSRASPGSFWQRAARRLASYRSRSPSSRNVSPSNISPSSLSTPRQGKFHQSSRHVEPRTPSRSYQVYNDALSPGTQPQTPAHLPEARHQSRYHPSYTAPVRRPHTIHAPPQSHSDSVSIQGSTGNHVHPYTTPSRRDGGRSESPMGLMNGGFQGLYGGRENGDEEQNWTEGVRFNNAEVRLWGLRDAGDDRSMREAPEPEDWRRRE